MKSPHVILVPILIAASANAGVLTDLNPFSRTSRPDYNPASLEADSAMENPSSAPFSPADSDFGVQQVLGAAPARSPVNVAFDTSVSYTDNAPGTTTLNSDSSWYSASRLAVSWRPRIAYGWFADAGLTQEIYRFERDKALDFENFSPYLGVVKSIPDLDDLVFYARYEYQRITTGTLSNSDYSAQRIRTGLQKDLLLASKYQLAAGVDAAFDINANPNAFQRNAYSANVGYTYKFTDALSSTLSWTGTLWDYRYGGREDWSQVVGLEATWMLNQSVRLYANVFYTNLDSNAAFGANDYEAWQTGLGLGLNFKF